MNDIVLEITNRCQAEISAGSLQSSRDKIIYLRVGHEHLPDMQVAVASAGVSLLVIFAVENFENQGISLVYMFEKRGDPRILAVITELDNGIVPSIASSFPGAAYYEREITDGFGVEFSGAYDRRRLFLHDNYPEGFHPLRKRFRNSKPDGIPSDKGGASYDFRNCRGEGVYQIAVGPVHAGIIEPGHFRFSVIGETIFDLEIRHFYTHRGLEKLAEGKTTADCVVIAAAVSGDESVANGTAYAMAIEEIASVTAPIRAWQLRTVLLELERIYSHLGGLAGMVLDVAYPVGAVPFFNLREEILRQNGLLTGSRFSKRIIVPGGMKTDISKIKLDGLAEYLPSFLCRLQQALSAVNASGWVIDRFETTGVVRADLVHPLNLSGPLARASGVAVDTRLDHPYGIYRRLKVEKHVLPEGDVLARFLVKAEEITNSVKIMQDIIKTIEAGPIIHEIDVCSGYGLGMVESARGQNLHWVYLKDGRIQRYKVRTASFCNWPAIEHAVMGNIVADFPLINKSFDLSYAGNDL